MKRALSLIIALLMLSASFASCSEKPSDETDKPVSETVASAAEPTDESETVETDAEKVTDNLPEKDFGGMDLLFTPAKSLRIPLFSLRKLTEKS